MLMLRVVLVVAAPGFVAQSAAQAPAAPAAPAQAAAAARFDILEYEIEGNSRLSAIEIERAVTPHLGPARTIDDVERAREALEKAYQARGFLTVTVAIPEQQVADGLVRLQVAEGRVDRLRVTGSRYYSLGQIRARVPALAEGAVPDFAQVQTQLAALNRSEDRRIQPVLRAGRTPGTVEVDLQIEDKLPLHGDVELNNRQSASTKPLRLAASVRYDNLWQLDHSIGISTQVTPQDLDQVRVLAGTYVVPGVAGDNVVAVYAVRSDSDVAAIGTLNVLGKGSIYGARFIAPQKPVDGFSSALTLGADYKSFRDRINLNDADSFTTPISYAVLVASATGTWRATAPAPGAPVNTTQAGVTLTFGPRGFLGTNDAEFQQKRAFASASFLAARADVSRLQGLGGRFAAYAKVEGQLASGALVSNEQYFLGGADTVRGYREAEALGDDGLRGTAELRYAIAGSGTPARGSITEATLFAFLDAGALRVREPLAEQRAGFQLASTGLGFRLKGWRGWRLWGDVARVLRDGPPLRDGPLTKSGDTRLLLRLGYEF